MLLYRDGRWLLFDPGLTVGFARRLSKLCKEAVETP
jgi:hypothetical protein